MNKINGVLLGMLTIVLMAMAVSAVPNGCVSTAWWNDSVLGAQNVSAGHVCINDTSYDVPPTAVINCNNTWAGYVDGACTYASYYVGFKGDGTDDCVATDWVVKDPVVQITQGYIINTTINASISGIYITNAGEVVPAKNACLNAYTTMGPTGYCSGGTTLDTNGSLANVTAGNVCGAGVDSQPNSTISCANNWANYVDGACNYTMYYVGYVGDGTATCVATDWVVRTASVYIAQDYIINTTINAPVNGIYVTDTGETPSYNVCVNAYTRGGTTGYCNGGGVLDANGSTVHVTAGNVCYQGTIADPNATTNCGIWENCVADDTTAPTYYVGYAGSGSSCVDTDWKTTGNTVNLLQRIRTTEHVATCSLYGYVPNYAKSDMEPIVVDGLGTAGASVISWVDLLVTLLVVLFIVGVVLKVKGKF